MDAEPGTYFAQQMYVVGHYLQFDDLRRRVSTPSTSTGRRYLGHQTTWYLRE